MHARTNRGNRPAEPFRIVFVCTGNICRSPAAENVFRHFAAREGLADMLEIDSAGTGGWHEGEAPDRRSQRALRDRGYPVDGRARALVGADYARWDLFVCMDRGHVREVVAEGAPRERVVLLRSFDDARSHDEVPDPYYGGEDGFDDMMTMIEAAMSGLIARVRDELARRATEGDA
ncbi:MAG: putative low molecular weight protein-tyrosine-phosphatase [Planctomycetota bacterium]|jgi:protein-tyrosine phosphatase